MAGLPTVCVLAGGRGTRLGNVTDEVPKPMVEVAGRPFLRHQLALLARHGAHRVVLCVGYLGEVIERGIGAGRDLGLDVRYAYDGDAPAGTAGAVRGALPLLGDRFLVLYGDTYLRIDYGAVAAAHARSGLPALMAVLRNADRWDRSNSVFRDGRVVAYDKRVPPPGAEWIDYGLLCMTPQAVGADGPADLSDVQHDLAARGLLAGYPATERFFEIGTPAALRETEDFLLRDAAAR